MFRLIRLRRCYKLLGLCLIQFLLLFNVSWAVGIENHHSSENNLLSPALQIGKNSFYEMLKNIQPGLNPSGKFAVNPAPGVKEILDTILYSYSSPIKLVVFDWGNVIYAYSYREAAKKLAERFKVDSEVAYKFFEDRNTETNNPIYKFEKGKIAEDKLIEEMEVWLKEHSILEDIKLTKDIFEEIFNSIWTEPIVEIVALIRELQKKGHEIRILSTTNDIHFRYYIEKLKISDLLGKDFRKIFYASHLMEFSKPDRRSYLKVTEDADVNPENALFIDDREDCVWGAVKAGLKTHLFDLKKPLEGVGMIRDLLLSDYKTQFFLPSAAEFGKQINIPLVKAIVNELLANRLHPVLEEQIEKFKKEMPSPDVVSKTDTYHPDLFTIEQSKFVLSIIDEPGKTYFEHYREIHKRVTKEEWVKLLKDKMKKNELSMTEDDFDFITTNLVSAFDNLFINPQMAGLTRYHYQQLTGNIIRMLHPNLWEELKNEEFYRTEEVYSGLRKDIQDKGEADFNEALEMAMEYSAIVNILERRYFADEHFKFDANEIKRKKFEKGDFFKRLFAILADHPEGGTILWYLDNPGELPIDMLPAELLLEKGFNLVFAAKDDSCDDLTVADVETRFNKWLKDERFNWLQKYYGQNKNPKGNELKVISTNSDIPGLNLAQLNDEHIKLRKEAICVIYKGGGNLYGTYSAALEEDSFYIYTNKEPIQTLIAIANGDKPEEAGKGRLVFLFKAKGEKGLNWTNLAGFSKEILKIKKAPAELAEANKLIEQAI